MKIFNLFFALLIITGLSVLIHSCAKESTEQTVDLSSQEIQTETRTSYCDGSGGICSGAYLLEEKVDTIIGILSYPNCRFVVRYEKRECPDGADVIFKDLAYFFLDPGCADFDMYTNGPNANDVIDQVLTELIDDILKRIGFDLAQPCGSPGGPKYIAFFQSTCVKRCLIPVLSEVGVTLYRFVDVPCGKGCCKTVMEVCHDNNNYLQTNVISAPQPVRNCPSLPTVELPCPSHTIIEGVCRATCLQLMTGG